VNCNCSNICSAFRFKLSIIYSKVLLLGNMPKSNTSDRHCFKGRKGKKKGKKGEKEDN